MIIQNYTSGVALFASAYLYYSNPTTSSTTNYLPIPKFNKNTITKKIMDDGKRSMLIFAYNAIKQTERGRVPHIGG
jgi:hypothetical protein